MVTCEYCGNEFYPGDGAWDDGDYMCPDCIARYVAESDAREEEGNQGASGNDAK